MTRITQVEDRGAAVAWSPIAAHADVIALGAKDSGAIGFDDYGGELELYDFNLTCPQGSQPKPQLLGSIKTASRFASIGWTPGSGSVTDRFRMGLVAGGMLDGTVHVWNPQAILKNEQSALVASIKRHAGGAVKALRFNSLTPNLMATGGSDGQVLITSLDAPNQPNVYMPGTESSVGAQVTQLAWNTQVSHIVASAAGDGSATVWDLKSKKPWCRLQAESAGVPISDLAWNPSQGLHMVTASGDDRNPLLKLWDLRASTTMPLATLVGHTQGILSLAWCPHDDTLLLSCGKDNRTILWDLYSLQPIADIPNEDPVDMIDSANQNSSSNLFSTGGLSSSQQRRYDVQWSPLKRGVVSTCSFDRKVQVHSVIGLATKSGRPPKWLKPSSGVSCGFGGAVVSFSSTDKIVKINNAVEQADLVDASMRFEAAIASGDLIGFCQSMALKAAQTRDAAEAQVWGFMEVIFEANAREQLLEHLGFHHDTIAHAAMHYGEDMSKGVASLTLETKGVTPPMTKEAERAIKDALLVGNFEAAVECCFQTGNLADGLILASCGGADLWAQTQQRYFDREAKKRSFLSVVNAIIHSKLGELVAESKPSRWQETLAILSTYGQSDEFPSLCIALGDRLEASGDAQNASLCYMCALSLERAVRHWHSQLQAANKAKGGMDVIALHEFIVKVTVFLKAIEPSTTIEPEIAELFSLYSRSLSEQGLLVTAAKYARGYSDESKILRDRLYRSRESQSCLRELGTAPEFPFSLVAVNQAPVVAANSNVSQRQQQSYPQQHAAIPSSSTQQQTSQPAQQPSTGQALPTGWLALQDPGSGQTYYANQITGETTWERPQSAPVPVPPAETSASRSTHASTAVSSQQHQPQQSYNTNGISAGSTPARLASKYGDGFVTSASHPELAQQYGNVGTSNPYTGAMRPGTASVTAPVKPPVSGTFDPNATPELSPEHEPIKDCLLNLVQLLSGTQLTGPDKRQLSEGEKGIAILLKRLSRGDINSEVAGKVMSMVDAINNRDFATAAAIQTGLVNHDWRDQKDWLKGIKFLIQLASKKLY